MKAVYRLSFALILLGTSQAGIAESGLNVPGIDANNALWQEAMNRKLNDT